MLDTASYGAHTTASDALWVGVPFIKRSEETFASRVARILPSMIELPEPIVDRSDDSFDLALTLALASDPAALGELRRKLAFNRTTTALFDGAGYTAAPKALFLEMWRRYRAGSPLTTLKLSPLWTPPTRR